MVISKLKPIPTIQENLLEELKQLIPEAISEGKINWEVLKKVLGEHLEDDNEVEHFGMSWPGKRQARRLATLPSKGTLKPVIGEGIDEENTGNIFIEGDNLEVLKLLQKSYAGRIKMIYIDPPYNTGKDFIYKDNYKDTLDDYLKRTNQIDEEGNLLTTNLKSAGRFHSNWLNMMYPRLRLARSFLQEDGIIFISIDDNEVSNLKKLCDEIFGEENSLLPFIWSLPRGINAGHISRAHEYIIAYAKNKESLSNFLKIGSHEYSVERCNKKIDERHPASSIEFPAGIPFEGEDCEFEEEIEGSEKVIIEGKLIFRNGRLAQKVTLTAGWTMKNMILDWLEGKDVYDSKGQKVEEFFFKSNGKLYSKKIVLYQSPKSILSDIPDTQDARKEIEKYLGSQDIFPYPKPSELIKRLARFILQAEDKCLDFFSGSCPTAHALLDLNEEDRGSRKFITVQLPEICKHDSEAYKEGYKNIAEIGKERIRRVITQIKEEQQNQLEFNAEKKQDLGFKVYKLDKSNRKIWKNHQNENIQTLEDLLSDFENPLIDGWKEEDVVTEIQLIEGFPLDSKIEQADVFSGNRVLEVASALISHKLFICLENKLKSETVELVKSLASDDIFICLDNALTDEAKLQLTDSCNVKAL